MITPTPVIVEDSMAVSYESRVTTSDNRRSFAPRGGALLYGKTPNGGNYFKPPAGAEYC